MTQKLKVNRFTLQIEFDDVDCGDRQYGKYQLLPSIVSSDEHILEILRLRCVNIISTILKKCPDNLIVS